jgi:hypothetical protein
MKCGQDPSHSNVNNLNNVRCKASGHFRNKNTSKLKLRNMNITIRSKILGTCIGASVTLRRVISLELI